MATGSSMTPPLVCPSCGAGTEVGARYCSRCGQKLPAQPASASQGGAGAPSAQADATIRYLLQAIVGAADQRRSLTTEERAAVAALPPGNAFLIALQGPWADSRYLLDAHRITVGRHPDNDICLEDITVSRHHLELLRDATGYRIRDLGSLNGTYLNHDRVDQAELVDGDEIRIGKFRLVYYASAGGRSAAGTGFEPA